MPTRQTYLLHLYRSRSVSGWQWTARLDRLADGESLRFSDPELLLTYLQTLVRDVDGPEPLENAPMEAASPAPSTE